VCINKHDINKRNTQKIEKFCKKNNISIIGKVSFDPIVTKALVSEKTVIEYSPKSTISREIEIMWKRVLDNV